MEDKACGGQHSQAPYVYYVYGTVPELMPHMAFRRMKHFETAGRKIIKCPHCRRAFTTVDADEKVELRMQPGKAKVECDQSMPCMTCRRVVGIIYASKKPA